MGGDEEAELIRLACSEAPEGRSEWSLRLLADRLVELGVVDSISHEAVRQTLKKRTEAPSEATMGDPSRRERPVCGEDGIRAFRLRAPLRSGQARGLPRRDASPTDQRGPRANPSRAGAERPRRTIITSATGWSTCRCSSSRWRLGAR
jgi:hypothetical protein